MAAPATARRTPNLAGAIYGNVLATSTVAALSTDPDLGATAILASLVATVLVFWVAHAYAEVVSATVLGARTLPIAEVRRVMAREWSIAQAAIPTGIPLALAGVGLWSTRTGVTLALAGGVLALAGWGLVFGRRARLPRWRALVVAVVSAAFGLVVVALKVLVH
jgi:hypothetical protein